jgi:hypothetical protein
MENIWKYDPADLQKILGFTFKGLSKIDTATRETVVVNIGFTNDLRLINVEANVGIANKKQET